MAGKTPRTFGGVKAAGTGTSRAGSPPNKPGRVFGGVQSAPERGDDISNPLSQVRAALRRHTGLVERIVAEVLSESDSNPVPSVLWRHDAAQVWTCPYHCSPVQLPSGQTHSQDCEHWTRFERKAIQLEGTACRIVNIDGTEEECPF